MGDIYDAYAFVSTRTYYLCPECRDKQNTIEERVFAADYPGGIYSLRDGHSEYASDEERALVKADIKLVKDGDLYTCPYCHKVWRIMFVEHPAGPDVGKEEA